MKSRARSLKKTDPLVEEIQSLRESIDALRDRTRNDSFMLTQLSQDVQVLKSEGAYTLSKVKSVTKNPIIQVTEKLTEFTAKNSTIIEIVMAAGLLVLAFQLGRHL